MENQTNPEVAAEDEMTPAAEQHMGTEQADELGPAADVHTDVHAESNGQPAGTESQDPTPEQIIAELETALAAAQDKLQRATAEFQNTTRRQERRLLDSIERANQALVTRLLPVMDDFNLAFDNVPDELAQAEAAWLTGFEQIRKKLSDALAEDGVAPIDDTGAEFDPTRHEAVTSEPSDEVASGHIIQTLRVGYEHKGRVLRPALVRVAA